MIRALGHPHITENALTKCLMIHVVNLETQRWNTRKDVSASLSIAEQLFHGKPHHIFLRDNPKTITALNRQLSGSLTRRSWQNHAVSVALFYWYCAALRFPVMSEQLNYVLPMSLLLVDSPDDALRFVFCSYWFNLQYIL